MSAIKKCDICGKTYEPYGDVGNDKTNPNGFSWLSIKGTCGCPAYKVFKPNDTCIDCRDKIMAVIDSLKDTGEVQNGN